MKGSAIENHVSGFFIKFPTFCFKIFIIKSFGAFGDVSSYLASYVLYLIMYSTHNSYNGGKKYLRQKHYNDIKFHHT
jgi:hypothetical protein